MMVLDEMKEAALLILANKEDTTAMSISEIADKLDLEDWSGNDTFSVFNVYYSQFDLA